MEMPPLYHWAEPTDLPPDPVDLCSRLQRTRMPALLHSAMQIGAYGDWSIVTCEPDAVLRARGRAVTVDLHTAPGGAETALPLHMQQAVVAGDPFATIESVLAAHPAPTGECGLPFCGGLIGYLSYDLGRLLEPIADLCEDDIGAPDYCLGLYTSALLVDHRRGEVHACGYSADSDAVARERAVRIADLARQHLPEKRMPGAAGDGVLKGNFTRDHYIRALRETIAYIYAGDIFQANLSQRFETRLAVSAWELYRRLSESNPAPFAAYLDFEDTRIVSASPERFVKVQDGRVETRPIKGTRARGATPETDRALAEELLASEKDGAELTMIVDLERNDLGRVCRFGSVRVPELCVLESYPTVHHLVATVIGELRPGATNVDLLRASFPGGSITGAPKIRERAPRGPYTGATGWLGAAGDFDLAVAIRTALIRDGRLTLWVGGGVVADSTPEGELAETWDKARAFRRALWGVTP